MVARELLRLSDPRLDLVTVTSVVTSKDLRHARIFWVVSGGPNRRAEVEEAFEAAAGVLRSRVAREISLRVVPQLAFTYDDTLDVQQEVESLIARINKP